MRRRFIYNYKIDIPNNEIWYTSTNSNIVAPYSRGVFGANILSNAYYGDKGIIKFDGDVTSIGSSAFYNCYLLTSITIPDSVTTIGRYALSSCSRLTSVTIPDSVTTIGEWAFSGCSDLTSITIPNSVTTIGESTFSNSGLIGITIPNSVTSIGRSAFIYVDSITSITIPDSIITIGDWAFYDCSILKEVYCKATTPPTLGGTYVFDENATDRKIYVPYQSLDAYKTASNWSNYADDIVGYDFENDTIM